MGIHRAVVNRLNWDVTQKSSDEIYVQKTTPNFIDALWDIFMPLIRGQSTVIVPEDIARDPERLIDLMAREGATRIVLVPSLLRTILASPKDLAQRLPKMRHWACSGEAPVGVAGGGFPCPATSRRTVQYLRHIGILGCDVDVAGNRAGFANIPIGSADRQYASSHSRCEFRTGSGERDRRTVHWRRRAGARLPWSSRPNCRSIPADPYGEWRAHIPNGRFGAPTPDGIIEFVGRRDHQVKLRGHRIELSEIERALESHPNLRNAVVNCARTCPAVNLGWSPMWSATAFCRRIRPCAPTYRANCRPHDPGAFRRRFPNCRSRLTASLIVPSYRRPNRSKRRYASASLRNQTRRKLIADIWVQILGLKEVGVDDSFFELGGNSLMLLRVQNTINQRLHRDIPATVLFRYPTIRALSAYLADGQRNDVMVRSMSRGEARKKLLTRRTASPASDVRPGK